ncbi:MAG: DUF4271 domain-containing protein [Muribaculaceae bacterium]|nr:DUF4271 domain-containing protein [Muribaculaceae bacterium]
MTMGEMLEYNATSWIYVILFSVFLLVCLRVRGNFKFLGSFFHDLAVVRERENMFDATMKETSFIFLVLLLSGCSIGVLLYYAVSLFRPELPVTAYVNELGLEVSGQLPSTLVGMLIACGYIGAMWVCYTVVGKVFSDTLHTWLWVRGFTAGTGLAAAVFFPLALLALAYPAHAMPIVIAGLVMLILVKFIFIVKGFRIFFSESSLWVVFLYYLCSLEIVPLVITFGLACALLG